MEVHCTTRSSDAAPPPTLDLSDPAHPLPSGGVWSVRPLDMRALLYAIRSRYNVAFRANRVRGLEALPHLEVVIHDDALAHIPIRWLNELTGWYDYFRVGVRFVGDSDVLFGEGDPCAYDADHERTTKHQRTARLFLSGCARAHALPSGAHEAATEHP